MTISEHIKIGHGWVWIGKQIDPHTWSSLFIRSRSVNTLQRKLAQWQAIRKFEALDDESLQDIGIERFEIREFVRKGGH